MKKCPLDSKGVPGKLHTTKTKNFIKIVALFYFILIVSQSYSQLTILSVEINMIDTTENQSFGLCTISISDTSNCDAILLELYDAMSDIMIFDNEFLFDDANGLPNGFTWSRSGNLITLGLGLLPKIPIWNARVRLQDSQSNWSPWEQFIFN